MLAHTSWGSCYDTLLTIYKSLILSKLEYNSFLLLEANKNALSLMDKIHNMGAKLATGAFRSSPIESILNLSELMPLNIKRRKSSMILAAKLSRNNFITLARSSHAIDLIVQENNIDLNNIFIARSYISPPWVLKLNIDTRLSLLPKSSTSSLVYNQHFKEMLFQYPNSSMIYTDASKLENDVGLAIIYGEYSETYKTLPECSIYTAEAFAIVKALEFAIKKNLQDISILSDSLTTITSINNIHNASIMAKLIHHHIALHYAKGNSVRFIWIPGHSSIEGNERADKLAKIAATSTTSEIIMCTPFKDIKQTIKH